MNSESILVEIFVREVGRYFLGSEVMVTCADGISHTARKIASFEEVTSNTEFLFIVDEQGKTIKKIRKDAIVERVYS